MGCVRKHVRHVCGFQAKAVPPRRRPGIAGQGPRKVAERRCGSAAGDEGRDSRAHAVRRFHCGSELRNISGWPLVARWGNDMDASPTKLLLLAFYAAALASCFVTMPSAMESVLQIGALVLLVAHALEAVVCLRYVRLYDGPLAVSILLTLLFGFIHWMPYKRQLEQSVRSQ